MTYDKDRLNIWHRKMSRFQADLEHAERSAADEAKALESARTRIGNVAEAQKLCQAVAEAVQRQAHERIAGVVSRCLEAVFQDQAYALKIDFERKRGRTEARLYFERGGQEFEPDAVGGGVIDVASFALRLSALVLTRPKRRLFLCLDEPFRMLSVTYRPAVRELLEKLCEEMQLQIVMVTHMNELVGDDAVELES